MFVIPARFHISSLGSWFFFGAAASLIFPFDTHMRNSLVNIITYVFLPALKLPGDSSEARSPSEKRNDIRQGLAASHVNSHWLLNPRHIVPKKTQWKWTWGMWQDSCNARFLWKNKECGSGPPRVISIYNNIPPQDAFYLRKHTESGVSATHVLGWKKIRNPGAVDRVSYEFTVTRTQDAFYLRKHKESGGVGTACIFHWKTTTISPGWAGVTCKFTVEMKVRRVLHEKTTTISPRSAGVTDM